jgi:hypothetical protein
MAAARSGERGRDLVLFGRTAIRGVMIFLFFLFRIDSASAESADCGATSLRALPLMERKANEEINSRKEDVGATVSA